MLDDQMDKAKIKLKRPCVFKTLLFEYNALDSPYYLDLEDQARHDPRTAEKKLDG